ncbi:hypothetical protein CTAYLR_004600 [Chrysophaeum taylorii]|uniref:Class II aldolase/adducin N-terminal domain-containing protein n=1 Tax=Chrysophaeum taylorii TaxID=2483200 RepID=A0AAD7XKQ2_9STRA|nr:hypothetical protein CTAYLR_004600 [Chrysophaeum taylorii]
MDSGDPLERFALRNSCTSTFARAKKLWSRNDDSTANRSWTRPAVCIHRAVHRALGSRERCVLHLHPFYATTLASLEDSRILPIDQNANRRRAFSSAARSTRECFGGFGLLDDD